MATHSVQDLANLWRTAGGSTSTEVVMVAIALAESGGSDEATGGDGEVGIWQIDPVNWPTYNVTGSQLRNGAVNAEVAFQLSGGGTNIGPWCTAWADPNDCNSHPLSYPQAGSPAYAQLATVEAILTVQVPPQSAPPPPPGASVGGGAGSSGLQSAWSGYASWVNSGMADVWGYFQSAANYLTGSF